MTKSGQDWPFVVQEKNLIKFDKFLKGKKLSLTHSGLAYSEQGLLR